MPSSGLRIERLRTSRREPFDALVVLPIRSSSRPPLRRTNAISPRWMVGSRSTRAGELSLSIFVSAPLATFRR
jgi:hypothetical protein